MTKKEAWLALEDGRTFRGFSFGAEGEAYGEVVFNTSLMGYQEILTDPSYKGQLVCMTYPLIGNYGVNLEDVESRRPFVEGFVVKEASRIRSNWRSTEDLGSYLARNGVVGIEGIDTRAAKKEAFEAAHGRRPAVCLPGLTRNGRDFHDLALTLAGNPEDSRDVYTLDYRGRGLSQSDPDWRNYAVPVETQDVLDFMTMRGLSNAAIIGTSRGGIIAMVMAAAQPSSVGAVILNDIGPVIEPAGLGRIAAYVGRAADKVARNEKEGQTFRANMVKVAALALAAIEAHDSGYC